MLANIYLHYVLNEWFVEIYGVKRPRPRVRLFVYADDFLGFKIHLRAFADNPERFWVARQASEKSRRSLKEGFHEKLHIHLSIKEAREIALQIWRGWCNYFRYSNNNHIFYREIKSVRRYIYRYLKRKFRRQRRPVPWRKLVMLCKQILKPIKPLRVYPNHLSQKKLTLL